jgi:pyruvate dehydrogenase E1 component alpha subunit
MLRERGVGEEQLKGIAEKARAEMDAAREAARAAPWPEPALAYRDVQDAGAPAWTR